MVVLEAEASEVEVQREVGSEYNALNSMKKILLLFAILLCGSCQNFGQLKVLAELPSVLDEVSGVEKDKDSGLLWMLNDSGNAPVLYGVDLKGKIKQSLKIKAKNHDWEDLTTDEKGNLYIADFGNNGNKRRNLKILKVAHKQLQTEGKVMVEKIHFYYPEQRKFPPKKKKRFFDAESILYKDGYLYIFTKSRVKHHFGKTTLYKIPAQVGDHKAELISTYASCNELECWITSAAISPDGKKVVLLSHDSVLLCTGFKGDDFFSGTVQKLPLGHLSQKEGVCFKDNNTLYITDERSRGKGRMLYEFLLP